MKPDRWVDLRETGRVASFTITYVKDLETGDILEKPVVLVVQDGADTTYMIELNPKIDFKDTYIGMPVKVHWSDSPNGNLSDLEYYDLVEDDAKDLDLRKD